MFGHGHHHFQHPPPGQPYGGGGHPPTPMPGQPPQGETFKIFCRADESYCVTIRDDAVVLAPANPRDDRQHWYKEMSHSTSVKDKEGSPAFALINKATGLAIKHSLGQSHPVLLAQYNPEFLDESLLWTESKDVGKGFKCIRMVNNIYLNLDAFHGDKDHGGVRDGTLIVLWEWCKGDNQSWKMQPWGVEASQPGAFAGHGAGAAPSYDQYRGPQSGIPEGYPAPGQAPGYGSWYGQPGPASGGHFVAGPMAGASQQPGFQSGYGHRPGQPGDLASQFTVRIFCRADEGYSLTIKDGNVCLTKTNAEDDFQHWVKDMRHSNDIKDEEGYPAFALVNKVTGEAIKHSLGQGHPVKLVPYNPHEVDGSVLWTESRDVGKGFRCIRMVNNIYLNFDAFNGDKKHGGVKEGTTVVLWEWCKGDNQSWKIVPW